MKTYIVKADNQIALAAPAADTDSRSGETFSTQAELTALAAGWPAGRLVSVWNALPAIVPVRKFMDRKVAVTRIWKAVQCLWRDVSQEGTAVAPPTEPRK